MTLLLLLALSVAADATAAAIAAAVKGMSRRRGLLMAFLFGIAQAAMAALGWLGAASVGQLWAAWDHWVALALLAAIGAKMVWEAFTRDERASAPEGMLELAALAVATSVDALAVGISISTLPTSPVLAVAMIGGVTFLLTLAGGSLGRTVGRQTGRWAEVAGGIVLIGIGISIALQHTVL